MKRYKFNIVLITLLVVASSLVYVALIKDAVPNGQVSLTTNNQVRVKIVSGSVSSIAKQLKQQNIDTTWFEVQLLSRLMLISKKLKPGIYDLKPGQSITAILLKLSKGDSVKFSIRLIEGWTFLQFKAAIDKAPELSKEFQKSSPEEIIRKLGINEGYAEGLFFPDTYIYEPGDSDRTIYTKAYQAMRIHLEKAWAERSDQVKLVNMRELLKLASIIEKETGLKQDQKMISSVFHNRLRIGMPLQTDPSVIYGLGLSFDGNLRKKDLLKDTPYNTYTRYGLPPTPICMPSKDALIAAANPAESKMLYFVARGDGSSEFSETLHAHEKAVRRYQLGN